MTPEEIKKTQDEIHFILKEAALGMVLAWIVIGAFILFACI